MIAYKRGTKEKHAEKAEHGKQRDDIVSGGKEQSTAPFCVDKPQGNQPGYCCQQREICNDFRRINVPPWIDEDQRMRPHQFAEIEPNGFTSDDQTFRECLLPIRTDRAGMKSLFPNRPRARDDRNQSKWAERQRIAPTDFSSHPPDAERE